MTPPSECPRCGGWLERLRDDATPPSVERFECYSCGEWYEWDGVDLSVDA